MSKLYYYAGEMDYVDEFNYPFYVIANEKLYRLMNLFWDQFWKDCHLEEEQEIELYFSNNKWLSLHKNDFKNIFRRLKEITPEEIQILKKWGHFQMGCSVGDIHSFVEEVYPPPEEDTGLVKKFLKAYQETYNTFKDI